MLALQPDHQVNETFKGPLRLLWLKARNLKLHLSLALLYLWIHRKKKKYKEKSSLATRAYRQKWFKSCSLLALKNSSMYNIIHICILYTRNATLCINYDGHQSRFCVILIFFFSPMSFVTFHRTVVYNFYTISRN